jgi:hypothetical protein
MCDFRVNATRTNYVEGVLVYNCALREIRALEYDDSRPYHITRMLILLSVVRHALLLLRCHWCDVGCL